MRSKDCLIVDDSKSARFSLTKLFEQAGHRVDAVDSGESALSYLEQTLPDIILMDHMMPGLDGFQTTSQIKANPRTASIPIVMCTAKEGPAYIKRASSVGAIGLLPKPASQQQVLQMFEQLERYEQQQITKSADRPLTAELTHAAAREIAEQVLNDHWDAFKLNLAEQSRTQRDLSEADICALVKTQVNEAIQASLTNAESQRASKTNAGEPLHDALIEQAKSAAEFTATHKALETAKQVAKETTQHELSDQMQRLYLPQIEEYIHDFLSNQEKKFNQLQLATGLCLLLSCIAVGLHVL